MKIKFFVGLAILGLLNCSGPSVRETSRTLEAPAVAQPGPAPSEPILVGAERTAEYLPLIRNRSVALVVNQTSLVGDTHLVDTLLAMGVSIKAIFAPEHGFRGEADAGAKIGDGRDPRTGIPLLSLYGQKREPSADDLAGVDWVLFDIQDVGARFYTYISTMHYVMQACAKHKVRLMVLDRPNPNGHFVDGPVLDTAYRSFVGMHPVPVAHGMTVGEYARMINGEGWLEGGVACDLTVIACANYDHSSFYSLPVRPSPNLPDMRSIYLYPSTCFFEGTVASEGRGTPTPFQVFGHPDYPAGDYTFTPEPRPGAMKPKLEGQLCHGYNLSTLPLDSLQRLARVTLDYLVTFYRNFPDKEHFFLPSLFFDKLAGGKDLRLQLIAGKSAAEIRASWQEGLRAFREKRKKYLLYPDFH